MMPSNYVTHGPVHDVGALAEQGLCCSPKAGLMGNGLLQVASTFTATPIRDSLRTAVVKAGVLEEVGFVLYAQMSEYLPR